MKTRMEPQNRTRPDEIAVVTTASVQMAASPGPVLPSKTDTSLASLQTPVKQSDDADPKAAMAIDDGPFQINPKVAEAERDGTFEVNVKALKSLKEHQQASTGKASIEVGILVACEADIIGTDGYDELFGTEEDDCIYALGDDDEVFSYGGDDMVFGGDGNDYLIAGGGSNTVFGGTGNDSMSANGASDEDVNYIYGGIGNDDMGGFTGAQFFYGGEGADVVEGSATQNSEYYGGENGDEILLYGPVTATGLSHLIYGGAGSDDMFGWGTTNSKWYGEGGADSIGAGAGNDIVYGGAGIDDLYGGDDNDILYGGLDMDFMLGGTGDDYLYTGEGNFHNISGDSGSDVLINEGDRFEAYGGANRDIIHMGHYDAEHNLADFSSGYGGDGCDTIYTEGADSYVYGGEGVDAIYAGQIKNTYAFGGAGDDVIIAQASDTDDGYLAANGGAGNDTITALGGDMTASGGSGDDTLTGNVDSVLFGGLGNDTLISGEDSTMIAGAGDDMMIFNGTHTFGLADGLGGNDTAHVYDTASAYYLRMGEGDDTVILDGHAALAKGENGQDDFDFKATTAEGETTIDGGADIDSLILRDMGNIVSSTFNDNGSGLVEYASGAVVEYYDIEEVQLAQFAPNGQTEVMYSAPTGGMTGAELMALIATLPPVSEVEPEASDVADLDIL